MTLTVLRDHTRISHQSLEKLLVPKIKNIRSHEDYADILALFYGYFHPLELLIEKHIGQQTVPDLAERRKSASLLSDLKYVHGAPQLMHLCTELPAIGNEAQALGALYVMEGSTLGGKIIGQMITKHLDIDPEKGLSFFYGYGNRTEEMWKNFIVMVNSYDSNGANAEEIAAAAEDTFIKFRNWVLEN